MTPTTTPFTNRRLHHRSVVTDTKSQLSQDTGLSRLRIVSSGESRKFQSNTTKTGKWKKGNDASLVRIKPLRQREVYRFCGGFRLPGKLTGKKLPRHVANRDKKKHLNVQIMLELTIITSTFDDINDKLFYQLKHFLRWHFPSSSFLKTSNRGPSVKRLC